MALPILSHVAMVTADFLRLVFANVHSLVFFFSTLLYLFTADIYLVNNIWTVLLV